MVPIAMAPEPQAWLPRQVELGWPQVEIVQDANNVLLLKNIPEFRGDRDRVVLTVPKLPAPDPHEQKTYRRVG